MKLLYHYRAVVFGFLVIFVLSLTGNPLHAQEPGGESILITNVYMIRGNSADAKEMVSILVESGKVKLVSKESISVPEGTLGVDGNGGFIIGVVDIDKPANFLILAKDPRVDFAALADTNTNAKLIIQNGKILKNSLAETEAMVEKKEGLALFTFDPWPISVPTAYLRSKKWNFFDNDWFNTLFVVGIFLDRNYYSQDDASISQVGDLAEFETGEIRAFRVGIGGAIKFKKPWAYTIAGASRAFDRGFDTTDDEEFTFFDYRLDIPVIGGTILSLGKMKENISQERIMSMVHIGFMERAAYQDAFLPSRNIGVVLRNAAFQDRMSWSVGAFNDWFDADESFNESSMQYIGRITGLPYLNEDKNELIHLGLGVRYSDTEAGIVQFKAKPENSFSNLFVDTDVIPADGATWLSLEAGWLKGPIWVNSEFLQVNVNSEPTDDPTFYGYHVSAVWTLTGEHRPYDKKRGLFRNPIPAKGVDEGGIGMWSIGARYSYTDATDGLVKGGEMGKYTIGLRWAPTWSWFADVNYGRATLDRFDLSGDTDIFHARVAIMLE
jgi:phosphate-selective porin OprO/OprP